ncbi:hypothetical protein P5V15_001429 [Pogonomyrmex californicus]
MSLSFRFTGKSSVLTTCYFSALNLSDDDYELGFTNFETYNTILNVDSTNNKFYYGVNYKTIAIPEGSYELSAIDRYLSTSISQRRRKIDESKGERSTITSDDDESDESDIVYDKNDENTMKSEIRCAYRVNFAKPNNIGSLLNSHRHASYDRINGTRV